MKSTTPSRPEYPLSIFLLVGGAALILLLQPALLQACPLGLPETSLRVRDRKLTVEVAIGPAARACGLSHRHHLPRDHGMLFVYGAPKPLSYWMKDTFIALSIAFMDDAGRIMSIQQMAPNQTAEHYRSPGPAQYALEVNRGWFAAHGIKVGDRVIFSLSAVTGNR